jgi:AcrR family transcriptional regulator
MARPQAEDYAQKQQLIRDRAAELFAARGFAGASIADIAAACGCAKSLIYHYFGSKQDILYDLLQAHVATLIAAATEAVARPDAPERRIRALIRALMELYADARAKHVLLLSELDSLPPARKASIVAMERRLVGLVADLFETLVPALAQRPDLRWPLAMSVFGLINWTHTWYRPDGALSSAAYAALAADLVLRGLPETAARLAGQPASAAARGTNESTTIESGRAPAETAAAVQSATNPGAPATRTKRDDRSAASRASTVGTRPRSHPSGASSSRVRVTR